MDSKKPVSAADARAQVEAERAATSSRRAVELARAFSGPMPGRVVVGASVVSTAVFVLLSLLAVVGPSSMEGPHFVFAVGAFLAGLVIFVVDLVLAALRSRNDAMGIGGLFFLAGSAPSSVNGALNGSLAVAVVVSIIAAFLRSQTSIIVGTLEPMLPLALSGLWGVRHGHFPQRTAAAISRGVSS